MFKLAIRNLILIFICEFLCLLSFQFHLSNDVYAYLDIPSRYYYFDDVVVGEYKDISIRIYNRRNLAGYNNVPVKLQFINILDESNTISIVTELPQIINLEDSCDLVVRFQPQEEKEYNIVMIIEGDKYIYLNGTGTPDLYAVIELNKNNINFGNVFIDSTESDTLWIKNKGVNPLDIELNQIVGNNSFNIIKSLQGVSVLSNDSDKIVICFSPIFQGLYQAELFIGNNDPHNDSLYIPLQGLGIQENPPPGPNPPGPPGGEIPAKPDPHLYLAYEELFTSGFKPDWQFRNASHWRIENDTLNPGIFIHTSDYLNGSNNRLGEYLIFTKYQFNEYTIKVNAKTLENLNQNQDADFGLITQFTDSLHYDYVFFDLSKYLVGYYRVTPSGRDIIKEMICFASPDTQFHDIEIMRQNGELWVCFDEQPVLYTDNVDSLTFVGLGSFDDAAAFKDFQVWVNDLSVIPPDTFTVMFEAIPDSLPLSEFTLNQSMAALPSMHRFIENETINVGTDSIVPDNDGGRHRINNINWIPKSQSNFLINANDTIRFIYDTQYHLEVESPRGNPSGAGWFNKNTRCQFAVDSVVYPQNQLSGYDSSDTRYRFVEWIGDGLNAYSGSKIDTSIVLHQNTKETANWKTQFSLHLFINDSTYGAVNTSTHSIWQDSATSVVLVAEPKPNCFFVRWEGCIHDTSDSIQVTFNQAQTLTAVFTNENLFPQLTLPIKNFNEDDTLFIPMSQFNPWVSDKNHQFDELHFSVINTSAFIHAELNNSIFIVWAEKHWHGNGFVLIRVNDPEGGYDVDTMFVDVQSINDPPASFVLLSPLNLSAITTSTIDFAWQESYNWDAISNDTINYTFYMGLGGSPLDSIMTIADTIFAFDMSTFSNGQYKWQVRAFDLSGDSCWSTSRFEFDYQYMSTIDNYMNSKPDAFYLFQNYPNPFNPKTTIQFDLPKATHVKITVYSIMGEVIQILDNSYYSAGTHTVNWDGTHKRGSKVSSGIYFYKLEADGFIQIRKMMYMK